VITAAADSRRERAVETYGALDFAIRAASGAAQGFMRGLAVWLWFCARRARSAAPSVGRALSR
jgi:hypothetical protein